MNKQEVLQNIIALLESDLRVVNDASKAAYEAATHEESKAEDQYDTRGVEASYLANAQALRATELERMIVGLKNFSVINFTEQASIANGALVELVQEERSLWVFLLPFGAGVSVVKDGKNISVVTPSSPMGQELINRKSGDQFRLAGKGATKEYEINRVY